VPELIRELITAPPEPKPELITAPRPKPRRKRDRRRTLTQIDMRSRLGKRIAELKNLFTAATGNDPSPVLRMRIKLAAELSALAEQARGNLMRGERAGDVLRLERAAASAVRGLGELERKPKPPTLAEVLAQAAQARLAPL